MAGDNSPTAAESAELLIEAVSCPMAVVDVQRLLHSYRDLRQRGVSDLDAYFESEPDAYCRLLQLVQVQYFNRQLSTAFRAESAGEILELLQPGANGSLAGAVRQLFVQMFRGVAKCSVETELEIAGGQLRVFRCEMGLVERGENCALVILSLFDLTEQHRLEREFARLNTLLQVSVSNSDLGVLEWDIPSGMVRFSSESEKLMGFPTGQSVHSMDDIFTRIHRSDVALVRRVQSHFVTGISPACMMEYRIRSAAGQWDWVSVRCTALEFDTRGLPTRAVGTIRLISQEKLEAQLLSLYNRALRVKASGVGMDETLAELASGAEQICPDVLCAIHRLDPSSGKFVQPTAPRMPLEFLSATHQVEIDKMCQAAQAAVRSAGLSIDEAPADDPFFVRLGPEQLGLRAAWCLPIVAPQRAQLGVVCLFSQESRQPQPTHAALLNQVARFAALLLEVDRGNNEREKLKRRILQDQKLESLGLLAGGIAHDFNNLLAGVLAHAELIMFETELESSLYESAEQICTAAQRAGDLCHQMLAFAGRGRSSISGIDVSALVKEIASLVKTTVPKNVSMVLENEDELYHTRGDAGMISQVVLNLLTNAVDAASLAGGCVQVRVGQRYVERDELKKLYVDDRLPGGEYVFIEVRDNGSGFDEDVGSRLFDPFFTTKDTGRGLGLAAVLGITRQHHGGIRIQSKPGVGSSFCVFLPRCKAPSQDAQPVEVPEDDVPWTLLLVDDEPLVRESLTRLFTSKGMRVITAVDGLQALKKYQEHRSEIDVVVLDHQMPNINGRETCRRLRQLNADLPVVMISGLLDYSREMDPIVIDDKTGAMTKPIRWKSIAKELRRVMNPSTKRQSA